MSRLLPRSLQQPLAQLRRDAKALADLVAGRRPSPLIERPARRPDSPAPTSSRRLEVVRVERETADATSLWLRPRSGSLDYTPGQFLTLLVPRGGSVHRRAYSLSSVPGLDDDLRITIKRVANGRVSNLLNDGVGVGQTLEVRGPSGRFVLPNTVQAGRLLLIGAGSGITPLFGLLRHALATRPDVHLDLVYGNRAEADVIFGLQLRALAERNAARFTLHEVLETPPQGWSGSVGRLDTDTLASCMEVLGGPWDHAFVCGPGPVMDGARSALEARGHDPARLYEERFSSPGVVPAARADSPQAVTLPGAAGRPATVTCRPDQTLLDAARAARKDLPFSCTLGGCGACRVRLVTGRVAMEEPNCLTAAERSDGVILTCVGRPLTPVTLEAL